MNVTPALRILIVAAVSVLALVGLVVRESLARQGGREVLLRMEAVDPRAVLSGHYVDITLREVFTPGGACPPGAADPGTTPMPRTRDHWVALAERGGYASVAAVGATRDAAAKTSPIVVRGEARCAPPAVTGDPPVVDLDVGVSRFHVNQAEAQRIDKLLASRLPGGESPVAAIVSVGQDGRARLKGLLVEGRRIELALL